MVVKIVTDSASDITQAEARQLGITVVPAYVNFGNETYRDGIDIDIDEFYRKLATSKIHPSTAGPSPGDFARVYQELARETDEIVSIHLSHKHSSIMESALLGKEAAQDTGCHIEVIDSRGVTMWQALVTIAAARAAGTGYGLQQVVERVHDAISRARGLGLLGTMRYAVKGGRLGNAISRVESLLDVKSLLTVHDGELRPAGLVRTWEKGVERLHEFIRAKPDIESVAIAHSALPNDARKLADYVTSLFPNLVPKIAQLGPILVTHTGPGTMMIATI